MGGDQHDQKNDCVYCVLSVGGLLSVRLQQHGRGHGSQSDSDGRGTYGGGSADIDRGAYGRTGSDGHAGADRYADTAPDGNTDTGAHGDTDEHAHSVTNAERFGQV